MTTAIQLKTLLETTPATLAEAQHDALKAHVLKVLRSVITAVEAEKYDSPNINTFYSPAGDGMGLDNTCLNFSWGNQDPVDISEVLGKLEYLKKVSKGGQK